MDQLDYGTVPVTRKATFSIPSFLSVILAFASFARDGAGWALVLSIAAVLFGIIGVFVAILPSTRGGLLSMLAILIGLIGVVVAVVRLLATLG